MNFNTLIAEIQSDINDSSARTKTRIESWINDGVQAICSKRKWSFLLVQNSDETSLVDTDMPLLFSLLEKSSVAVPAKFITNVFDVTDGTRQKIDKVDYSSLDMSDYDHSDDGVPLYWYETNSAPTFAKSLQFFPKLSTSTRKFIFSFVIAVPTYTSTEVIAIPDEYIYVLKAYVYSRIHDFNSDDRAVSSEQNYRQGISDMIRDLAQPLTDGNGRIFDRFTNGVTGV